jgi:hypothetical protein
VAGGAALTAGGLSKAAKSHLGILGKIGLPHRSLATRRSHQRWSLVPSVSMYARRCRRRRAGDVDSLITASSAEVACGGFHRRVPLATQPSERKRESFSPKSDAPDHRARYIRPPGTMARGGSQEQTQIITNAIGRPTPNAPPTINANAESKLSSAWTARLDMPLLHRAPTSTARRPKDERKKARVWSLPEPERFKAESLRLRKS